jgi:hypothetical protein
MNNKAVRDYKELFWFLHELNAELTRAGLPDASATVARASRFYGGSSTEFMGEARLALRAVREPASQHLDRKWQKRIDSVIKQIDIAFRQAGS